MNKNTDRFISLSSSFVKTLENAGYKFDYSEKSIKHLEFAINGLKSQRNSQEAIKVAYVYFAVYLSQVFMKEIPGFKLKIEWSGEVVDEILVTDDKSFVYLLSWIYSYAKKPKKESIVKKYNSTMKLISPKKHLN